MNVRERLAKSVRTKRQSLNLSQEDLAAACQLDRTYISGIERALRNPSLEVLNRLSKALNTSIGSLTD